MREIAARKRETEANGPCTHVVCMHCVGSMHHQVCGREREMDIERERADLAIGEPSRPSAYPELDVLLSRGDELLLFTCTRSLQLQNASCSPTESG